MIAHNTFAAVIRDAYRDGRLTFAESAAAICSLEYVHDVVTIDPTIATTFGSFVTSAIPAMVDQLRNQS